MDTETIVLNAAYVALLGSTQMRTVTLIRITLLVGSAGFIGFAVLTGIWSMLAWNVVTSGLHVVQLVRERRTVGLSDREERWRRRLVPDASPAQFRALWSAGVERRVTDATLTTQGRPSGAMSLIVAGTVEVRSRRDLVARLRSGSFVGEMGVLRHGAACADTVTVGDATLRQWSREALAALDDADPTAARELRRAATADALAKLTVDPASPATRIA